MSGLDQAIETAKATAGVVLGFGLATTLLILVLVGFYAWFVPKGPQARRSSPTRHTPTALTRTPNGRAVCKT